jgi:hypothetical protein
MASAPEWRTRQNGECWGDERAGAPSAPEFWEDLMRAPAILAACLLAAAPIAAMAQSGLPSLFAAAIADTVAQQRPVAYEVTVESARGTMRYAFNGAVRGDARVRVLAPAERQLEASELRTIQRLRREGDGDIWCASHKLLEATDVRVVREDDATAVYAFTPSVAQVGGPANAAMIRYVRGEATVSKASTDVTAMRIYSVQPFHASLARIDRFTLNIRCDLGANGRRYAAETETDIHGSALTQRIDNHVVSRISNVRPVG